MKASLMTGMPTKAKPLRSSGASWEAEAQQAASHSLRSSGPCQAPAGPGRWARPIRPFPSASRGRRVPLAHTDLCSDIRSSAGCTPPTLP